MKTKPWKGISQNTQSSNILIVGAVSKTKDSGKKLIFLSLPSETNDSTKFAYADTNTTLAPVSNTHETPALPQLADNSSSTMSQLAILSHGTDTAIIWENEINASSNDTAHHQLSIDTPAPSNCIPAVGDSISTAHIQPSNTATVSDNATKFIPRTFDDSDNSLSDAPSPSTLEDSEIAALRISTRNRANRVDYKKFFSKRKSGCY